MGKSTFEVVDLSARIPRGAYSLEPLPPASARPSASPRRAARGSGAGTGSSGKEGPVPSPRTPRGPGGGDLLGARLEDLLQPPDFLGEGFPSGTPTKVPNSEGARKARMMAKNFLGTLVPSKPSAGRRLQPLLMKAAAAAQRELGGAGAPSAAAATAAVAAGAGATGAPAKTSPLQDLAAAAPALPLPGGSGPGTRRLQFSRDPNAADLGSGRLPPVPGTGASGGSPARRSRHMANPGAETARPGRSRDRQTTPPPTPRTQATRKVEGALVKIRRSCYTGTSVTLKDIHIEESGTARLADALKAKTEPSESQALRLKNTHIGQQGAGQLADALDVNKSLRVLDLRGNMVGDEGAARLAAALRGNDSLTELVLFKNGIGDEGASALASALTDNGALTSLDLRMNSVGDAGALALAGAVCELASLTELDVRSCPIGYDGATSLARALAGRHLRMLGLFGAVVDSIMADLSDPDVDLQEVDLSSARVGDAGAGALAEALKVNKSLTLLDLCNTKIGDRGAEALGAALKVNRALQTLFLHNNRIGDEGAAALGSALVVNPVLTNLNLRANGFGNTGAECIADAIRYNKHAMVTLDLRGNRIGLAGLRQLVVGLTYNRSIKAFRYFGNRLDSSIVQLRDRSVNMTTLDFWDTEIGPHGAAALGEVLNSSNSTLTALDLHGRYIDIEESGALALAKALRGNASLTWLNLEGNSVGDEAAVAMSKNLEGKRSAPLRTLVLERCKVGNEAAEALADLLVAGAAACNLTSLNLRGNGVGDPGALHLARALRSNRSVTYLDLRDNQLGWMMGEKDDTKDTKLKVLMSLGSASKKPERDAGAVALADAVRSGEGALTDLRLSGNAIGDIGGLALAAALRAPGSRITRLSTRGNRMGAATGRALVESLCANPRVQNVAIVGDRVDLAILQLIGRPPPPPRPDPRAALPAGRPETASSDDDATPRASGGGGGGGPVGSPGRRRSLLASQETRRSSRAEGGGRRGSLAGEGGRRGSLAGEGGRRGSRAGHTDVPDLEDLFGDNSAIQGQVVDLAGEACGDVGAGALAAAFHATKLPLRGVHLRGCGFRAAGARALMEGLSTIPTLEELDVSDNEQSVIPREVLVRGHEAVADYVHEVGEGKAGPLSRAKWVLIGRSEAGRSTLLRTLRADRGSMGHGQEWAPSMEPEVPRGSAHALTVHTWSPAGHRSLQVNAWDSAGSTDYLKLGSQMFLTSRRTLFVLCFDVSFTPPEGWDDRRMPWGQKQELARLEEHATHLATHVPGCVMALVGNKGDKVDDLGLRQDRLEAAQAVVLGVIDRHLNSLRAEEADLEDGISRLGNGPGEDELARRWLQRRLERVRLLLARPSRLTVTRALRLTDEVSVTRLREALVATSMDTEHFPDADNLVPATWAKLIELVPTIGKPLLSMDDFTTAVYDACGFTSNARYRRAMDFAHEIGALLHFDSSPHLRGVVVADLPWLARAIREVTRFDFKPLERLGTRTSYILRDLRTMGRMNVRDFDWGARTRVPTTVLSSLLMQFGLAMPAADVSPDPEEKEAEGTEAAAAAAVGAVPRPRRRVEQGVFIIPPLLPLTREPTWWVPKATAAVSLEARPYSSSLFERFVARASQSVDVGAAWRGAPGGSAGFEASDATSGPGKVFVRIDAAGRILVAGKGAGGADAKAVHQVLEGLFSLLDESFKGMVLTNVCAVCPGCLVGTSSDGDLLRAVSDEAGGYCRRMPIEVIDASEAPAAATTCHGCQAENLTPFSSLGLAARRAALRGRRGALGRTLSSGSMESLAAPPTSKLGAVLDHYRWDAGGPGEGCYPLPRGPGAMAREAALAQASEHRAALLERMYDISAKVHLQRGGDPAELPPRAYPVETEGFSAVFGFGNYLHFVSHLGATMPKMAAQAPEGVQREVGSLLEVGWHPAPTIGYSSSVDFVVRDLQIRAAGAPEMRVISWRLLDKLGHIPRSNKKKTVTVPDAMREVAERYRHAMCPADPCDPANPFGGAPVPPEYYHAFDSQSATQPRIRLEFVSHRWLRPDKNPAKAHPDDAEGTLCRRLVEYARVEAEGVRRRETYFWIDYCCVDQDEPAAGLMALPLYMGACTGGAVAIDDRETDERGWCRAELALAAAFSPTPTVAVLPPDDGTQGSLAETSQPGRAGLRKPLMDPRVGRLTSIKDVDVIEHLTKLAVSNFGRGWVYGQGFMAHALGDARVEGAMEFGGTEVVLDVVGQGEKLGSLSQRLSLSGFTMKRR